MERQRKTVYRVIQRSPNPNGPTFEISTLCYSHEVAVEFIQERTRQHDDWRVMESINGEASWIRYGGTESIHLVAETMLV